MTALSIALYGAVMIGGGFWADSRMGFAVFLIAHGVAAGTFNTASASLTLRLFPQERFAQFSSAMGILICLGWTLGAPVLGKILDWCGNRYILTFWMGLFLSCIALLSLIIVYQYFRRYGGFDSYCAPSPWK